MREEELGERGAGETGAERAVGDNGALGVALVEDGVDTTLEGRRAREGGLRSELDPRGEGEYARDVEPLPLSSSVSESEGFNIASSASCAASALAGTSIESIFLVVTSSPAAGGRSDAIVSCSQNASSPCLSEAPASCQT